MNIKHKNMLFQSSELFALSPTKMWDVIMHPGGLQKSFPRIFNHRKLGLFEIQYSILFHKEQKHSLRRIISNNMEIFSKDVSPWQPET